jgi:hypothetical protein
VSSWPVFKPKILLLSLHRGVNHFPLNQRTQWFIELVFNYFYSTQISVHMMWSIIWQFVISFVWVSLPFLSCAFATLQKAATSCLSVLMEQLGCHWMHFNYTDIWRMLENLSIKSKLD